MYAFKFIHKTFLNIDPLCLFKTVVSQNIFYSRKCAGNSVLYKSSKHSLNTILFMCIALHKENMIIQI